MIPQSVGLRFGSVYKMDVYITVSSWNYLFYDNRPWKVVHKGVAAYLASPLTTENIGITVIWVVPLSSSSVVFPALFTVVLLQPACRIHTLQETLKSKPFPQYFSVQADIPGDLVGRLTRVCLHSSHVSPAISPGETGAPPHMSPKRPLFGAHSSGSCLK